MSRIRSIKPDWLEDERMVVASDAARVLSIALILLADDYGNGRAAPQLLAARVWPMRPEALGPALAELADMGFVALYEADSQHYFSIRSWARHQRVDRPGKERVPKPQKGHETTTESGIRASLAESQNIPGSRASSPFPSSPDPDPIPEGGSGGKPSSEDYGPMPTDWSPHPAAVSDLAIRLGYSEAAILDAAREFSGYWTIGAGMGKARSHWQTRFREHVRKLHERGDLNDIEQRVGADADEPRRRQRSEERAKRTTEKLAEQRKQDAEKAKLLGLNVDRRAPGVLTAGVGGDE